MVLDFAGTVPALELFLWTDSLELRDPVRGPTGFFRLFPLLTMVATVRQ